MKLKKTIVLIIIFLSLPFYLFAEENIHEKNVSFRTNDFVQKKGLINDKKTTFSENSANKAVLENSHKVFSGNSIRMDTDLNHNNKNNFRVARATEWNAYATIAIAILTIILAWETVRLRRVQAKQIKALNEAAIKPKVELFLDSNKYSINFLEIHTVNNGNGTANNLKFSFEADNNEAIEISKVIISKIEHINFFKIGLKHLGAGQNKKSFLMSVNDREFSGKKSFFKSTIFVTISCEDDSGKEYTYKYTLNMSEFSGISSIGSDPLKEISDNLKKISDSFTKIVSSSSGNTRIQTDIYDDSSREKEESELREWVEKKLNPSTGWKPVGSKVG